MNLLQVPLSHPLQSDLSRSWWEQYDSFAGETEEIEEIEFDAGYEPQAHERFCLRDYELPEWLSAEDRSTVPDLESIGDHAELVNSVKGVAAFARHASQGS